MRRVKIFSGSSHPHLVESICERLGIQPAKCELKKFSNGETSVSIGTSIRDQDVFIVQSGSSKINDSVMELLIMISACKGGSARSITAVMPYFPYSRQSKKKSHRGAITARMLANVLTVAGINHVITVDLHAAPMQGFFGKPVDNLHAEPLIARWIRNHVPGWRDAVVVSKNAGGTKRVTSLADALKLNFGIVTTDRCRPPVNGSTSLDASSTLGNIPDGGSVAHAEIQGESHLDPVATREEDRSNQRATPRPHVNTSGNPQVVPRSHPHLNTLPTSSPLINSTRVESESLSPSPTRILPRRSHTPDQDGSVEEYTDERAREVTTGRLIQGHIVDDDYPSPILSAMSGSIATLPGDQFGPYPSEDRDPMTLSFISTTSSYRPENALGSTFDAEASEEDEEEGLKNPELEHTITLIGNVKDKPVVIIDDMIDSSGSWVAAAETVVKRGGANKVYCIATHGLFGDNALEEMERCDCIDYIVVTNSFPISPEKIRAARKLVILDISFLLSEAIRRNTFGESISQLFLHYQD